MTSATAVGTEDQSYVVTGQVHGPSQEGTDGPGLAGVIVEAFDQQIGRDVSLGQSITDAAGSYRISFDASGYGSETPAEGEADVSRLIRGDDARPVALKAGPDLWVGIQRDEGEFALRSDVAFDAGPLTTIDLEVVESPSSESELERLTRLVGPRANGLPLGQLTGDQINRLSRDPRLQNVVVEAGVDAARVMEQVNSLASRDGIAIGDLETPLFAAMYAVQRSQPSLGLGELLARDVQWWSTAISAAVDARVIPNTSAGVLGRVVQLVTELHRAQRLDPATQDLPASLGDLLRALPVANQLSRGEQATVSALLDPGAKGVAQLPGRLRDAGWSATKVNSVVRVLGLGEVTVGHAPLVAALQRPDPDEHAATLEDLAGLARSDWDARIARHGVPSHFETGEDSPRAYVDQILRNIETRMPSAYVSARIADGRMPVAEAASEGLVRFLSNARTFRIGADPVMGRIIRPADDDLAGIRDDDVPAVHAELMRIERVVRISPSLEDAEVLLTAGYSSARQVTAVHRGRFVDELSTVLPGGRDAAEKVYERAAGAVSSATALIVSQSPVFNRTPRLPVLADESDTVSNNADAASIDRLRSSLEANGQTATLDALFGSQDYCACESCASMYSPAAYLVELMQMLDGGPKNDAGDSALDVLLRRRRDLGEVELTCDNTGVEIPYVDLVIEILESGLAERAFWNAFARGNRDRAGNIDDWGFDDALDQGQLPKQLHDDLAVVGIDVGDHPEVTPMPVTGTDKRWRVSGNGWRLHLRASNPARLRITLFPQSRADTSGNDSIPRQYVHWAYEPFIYERYPWVFPFDIDAAETDAWLERLKTTRREIVDAYAGAARFSDLGAACAVLGMGETERLRLMTPTDNAWVDWGFREEHYLDSNGVQQIWYQGLRVVSEFRQRARITHSELLQLLDTRFVQSVPGLSAPMVLSGDECNGDLMRVGDGPRPTGLLREEALRRIYLFIRLARRLGWSFRDLDAAIASHEAATEPVNLSWATEEHYTEAFIVYVANIVRLREATKLSIESLLNLFRDKFDTREYWDYTGSQPQLSLSFYERLLNDPVISRPRGPGLELAASRDRLLDESPTNDFPRLRLSDYESELAAAMSCRKADVSALLPPAATTIAPTKVGATGSAVVDGDWIDISAAESVRIEWVVGQPTDTATQLRIQVQELNHSGAIHAWGSPTTVSRGNGDWRHVVLAYDGTAHHLRVRIERTAGAGTMWFTARVLTGPGLVDGGPGDLVGDGTGLALGSLTTLCGHLRLSRAAKIATPDYVSFAQMSGIAPLAGPAQALEFLEALKKTRLAGMPVPWLDSLLRNRYATIADVDAAQRVIRGLLASCREKLRTAETALRPTPENAVSLTHQLLLELGWPDRLVDLVLGGDYLGRVFPSSYSTPLAALDDDVAGVLPAGLVFSRTMGTLEWSGPPGTSSSALSAAAASLRGTPEYVALSTTDQAKLEEQAELDRALEALATAAAQTQQDVADLLDPLVALGKSIRLPTHRVSYPPSAVPPASSIAIPPEWGGTFWYDPSTSTYQFVGPMTANWRDVLAEFGATPDNSAYRQAVHALYLAASTWQEEDENRLIRRASTPPVPKEVAAEHLLGQLPTSADRCLALAACIVPVAREQRATAVVQQLIVDTFDVEPTQAAILVERFRHAGESGIANPLISRDVRQGWLVSPSFALSDPAVAMDAAAFPIQFRALERLSKLALIASRCSLHDSQTAWLFGGWDTRNGHFDFGLLPQQAVVGTSPVWTQWLNFVTLLAAGGGAASRKVDLESIRVVASSGQSKAATFESLATILGIQADDATELAATLGANTPADLLDPSRLAVLITCAELLRRTGADASTLAEWRGTPNVVGATRARQLARALVGDLNWTVASRPVLDRLRRQRRDALNEYWVHRKGLRDANDLHGEMLVDPQMGPTATTSRVRQAITSVQVFIHRILMDLEPEVRTDAIDQSRWEWMRNYRVWEANRKVLLYPENWIEPELRLDQTPPFRALTTELLQGDMTEDAAEEAMRTYVDALGDVARVEAVGMFNEFEHYGLTRTHVIGRTRHEPHLYFYRTFAKHNPSVVTDAGGDWTAWDQLSIEMEGDHIAPLVWRGRLFVFWLIFGERAISNPATGASLREPKEPSKVLTVKLAWSEHRHGRWTPRRLFGDDAVKFAFLSNEDWQPTDFYLRPSVQHERVALSIYLNPTRVVHWERVDDTHGRLVGDPLEAANADRELLGYRYDLEKNPVVTLAFDGEDVRIAAWIWRQTTATSMDLGYTHVNPAEDPMVVDTTTSITPHRAMVVPEPPGPLSLQSESTAVTCLAHVPRQFDVLLPADEPVLRFRAPSEDLIESLRSRPLPFFLIDSQRQFFLYPTKALSEDPKIHITAVDHPQITGFRETLRRDGIDGLLALWRQTEPLPSLGVKGTFTEYGPAAGIVASQPLDDVEFSLTQPAGPYNWELFFHVALAIGSALTRNHQFAQARRWFHYIFNPTDSSADPTPERYWHFRPFREAGAGLPVSELVRRLADPADGSPEKQDFLTAINLWRHNPFEPHLVARLRPRSYMYAVVMKYLDNLIAWADQLYRRDTMEALDEATQLYILVAQILGRRPEAVPHRTRPQAMAFTDLRSALKGDVGALGNPLVTAENIIGAGGASGGAAGPLPLTLYFCVPGNPKLLEYYRTVDDRLTKLRSSMNIDGVVRRLAMFEPPIDPGMLVRARAAGIDLTAVLADADAPLPLYRFSVMSRTATELCAQVRDLGSALLSALEKRDSEAVARLRSGHELSVLASVRRVKELQIEEARANLEALAPALENAQGRLTYYVGLVSQLEDISIPSGPAGPTVESIAAAAMDTIATTLEISQAVFSQVDPISNAATGLLKQALSRASAAVSGNVPESAAATSKVPMNAAEKRNIEELQKARNKQNEGWNKKGAARFFAMLPDVTVGTSGIASPVATQQLGGTLLSKAAELFATASEGAAAEHGHRANLASILGSYQRRAADWVQQASTAGRDIEQATKQIAAAAIRAAIAAQDLRNHDLQVSNAEDLDAFMRDKFSNQELYTWMLQQTSDVYFRSYQMAYDIAKRAEQGYRHELGVDTTDFIKFGYWDSMRRGLTAGDHLLHDIKRMEVSYLNNNRRELEITKHVSLRQLDAMALLRLHEVGECEFEIPEALYDLDFPGHYFRRLKTVSISVPCVVGPYTGVNGMLTLLASSVRTKSVVVDEYDAADNYATSRVPIQSVATSTGQNDNGLFELAFHEDRYLPFEGAGALSHWRFTLPKEFRAFDYTTISDVILHVRYTARDGGEPFASKARQTLSDRLSALTRAYSTEVGMVQILSLRLNYPREWRSFKDDHQKLKLQLTDQQFPYIFRGRVTPQRAALVWEGESPGIAPGVVNEANEEMPMPAYEWAYDAASPLLAVDDPYLLVAYGV